MPLTRLRETDFIPFIDTKTTGDTASYKRLAKSTVFSLAFNPESESIKYISEEVPVEEVKYYVPEFDQEQYLYEGDPIYDFIAAKYEAGLPVGSACIVPLLLCFGGTTKRAWLSDATLLLNELNTVDGKISFNLKLGPISYGTYSIAEGVPTFNETSSD